MGRLNQNDKNLFQINSEEWKLKNWKNLRIIIQENYSRNFRPSFACCRLISRLKAKGQHCLQELNPFWTLSLAYPRSLLLLVHSICTWSNFLLVLSESGIRLTNFVSVLKRPFSSFARLFYHKLEHNLYGPCSMELATMSRDLKIDKHPCGCYFPNRTIMRNNILANSSPVVSFCSSAHTGTG